MRRKMLKFDKKNFLQTFKNFWNFVFKHEIIKNVWRKIDIYLFNFSIVLNFLKQRQAFSKVKIITSLHSLISRMFKWTFHDFEIIKTNAKVLRQNLTRDEIIVDYFLRFVKNFEMLIETFELHTRNLNDCLKIFESRKHRKRYS